MVNRPRGTSRPTYLVDTREQLPYPLEPSRRATLAVGDYSVEGLEGVVAVERKSIADAFASLGRGRERFEREVARLGAMRFGAVVVEGTIRTILSAPPPGLMRPKAVVCSLLAWSVKYRVPVFFCDDRAHAAAVTRHLLDYATKYLTTEEKDGPCPTGG